MQKNQQGLQIIPGIGKSLERDLLLIGIKKVDDLKGKDPEKLYRKLEKVTGTHQDRCVLYTFRCAVYFASHSKHESEKLKWWNWSDLNFNDRKGE